MLQKQYGTTGVAVSAIGFGGMRFENYDDREGCARLVQAAYDGGINYFDTAPGYGQSEEVMGLAFKEMAKTRKARPFYVSTKSNCADPDGVRRDLETSLKRLNLDYIDFFHVWYLLSPEKWEERKAGGALKAFERAKAEGLVRHICVSSHMSGSDIGGVLREYPFAGVLLGYSAMNFAYREAALEAAAELGRGVVVMNPLGGGIIPQNPERFSYVKTQEGESVVEGALRFLINDPRISVALVGVANQAQLREALSAAAGFKPIPPEGVARMRESMRSTFASLCTSCGYCNKCPQGIPISNFMDTYNCKLLGESQDALIGRLMWYWGVGLTDNHLENCTECGLCERVCTQKLPIIKRLQEIKRDLVLPWRRQQAEKARNGGE